SRTRTRRSSWGCRRRASTSRRCGRVRARPRAGCVEPVSSSGGETDGVEDLRVARAAAEVAGERLANLVLRRVGVLLEQCGGGDDETRRAEAALHGAGVDERLLHRV